MTRPPSWRRETVPEIAAAYGISENHLVKVVHQLSRSGTVEAVRGKGDGLRLAHAPEDIRLGRIVRAPRKLEPLLASG